MPDIRLGDIRAIHFYFSGLDGAQPDQRLHQFGLAVAADACNAENFSRTHAERNAMNAARTASLFGGQVLDRHPNIAQSPEITLNCLGLVSDHRMRYP